MNLQDITTKAWILALFKRDDGERFLLGDGYYDFKESLQHFSANSIANDIVELQGADGQLLAGQVKRATTQSFDGFVGDGLTSKAEVEFRRREFLQFFQVRHFYDVIYVFCDGTSIIRKRGFLVDAPEVPEIRQMSPTYHVALNFEDANYYEYAENGTGEEIFANTVKVNYSNAITGGLIWDEDGAVSNNYTIVYSDPVTATGNPIQLNLDNQGVVEDAKLNGNAEQQTYSGKNLLPILDGTTTLNGVTATVIDGILTLNGTSTASGYIKLTDGLAGHSGASIDSAWLDESVVTDINGKVISFDYLSGTAPSSSWAFRRFSTSTSHDQQWLAVTSDTSTAFPASGGHSAISCFAVFINANMTFSNYKVAIQLETGSTPTDFQKYVGGTASPNPDYPQEIQTVTGTQTVTINGTDYNIDLGNTKLCGIGGYIDYPVKVDGTWYIRRMVGKVVLDGIEDWTGAGTGFYIDSVTDYLKTGNKPFCDYFTTTTNVPSAGAVSDGTLAFGSSSLNVSRLYVKDTSRFSSTDSLKTWLSTHPTTVYYALAEPVDEEITNEALIAQLDAILAAQLAHGQNNFSNTAVSPNLAGELVVTYKEILGIDYSDSGYVWEEGSGGGATTIYVQGIEDALPVWVVTGEATNPTLTNVTTGQSITWTGTVPAGQSLVIDMENQTATLAGANVFTGVSGDWVELKVGTNMLTYYANGDDVKPSQLNWSGVVG